MTTNELRQLCINNNWFTSGTIKQYEKMFEYNNEINNTEFEVHPTLNELHTLAYLIWICSNNVTQSEIVEKLIEAECSK